MSHAGRAILRRVTTRGSSLQRKRAQSVVDYFRSKNVHPQRLEAVGKGESEPVGSNKSESGRQANRRVEIFVEPVRAES